MRTLRTISASAVCTVLVACGGGGSDSTSPPPPPPPAAVATVSVSPATVALTVGGTATLTAETRDAAGNALSGRAISWASSAPTIASVSGTGTVSAVAPGSAQVTATSEGRSGTATVTVTPVPVAAVTVNPATVALTVGGTATLTAETRDAAGNALSGRAISWASSAPTIASVSGTGTVSAVAPGSAQVTATSEGRSGTATITVTAVPVAAVTVTPDSSDVVLRGTRQLAAVARDAAGAPLTGRTITWTSSNPAIATVSASGLVSALTNGTVTITATSEGRSGTARVRAVTADLAAIIDSTRQAFNLPALGAAIITRNNGIIAIGVTGTRRFGQNLPVTLGDKWHIGSNSKAFTALLAALAVNAGRMGWNDLLVTRYPELATIARPEFRTTTLLDLTGMRSGIIGNPGFAPTGSDAQMRQQVDTWAIQQAPAATPGTYYYSNIAYQMLGEVAARAWGQPFTQAMQARVLTPLGITTAGFGPTTTAGATDQPSGHTPSGSGWTICEACDNAWANGSGKMHMSLGDWARYAWEQLRADAGQSTLLTQAESRALSTSITAQNANRGYGYGWEVPGASQRILEHDGSNNRNRSRAVVYLDAGVAFLLVTNAGDPAANGGAPNQAFNALWPRLQAYYQNNR